MAESEDTEQQIIRETFHLVSKRDENVCNFLEGGMLIGGSDYKLIYRHYATLYFVFCVDSSESELGILDLIQVFVETLDKCFENVCELDLIFHVDKVHNILAEMVMGGMVLETNMNEIIMQVDAQNKMEKSEACEVPFCCEHAAVINAHNSSFPNSIKEAVTFINAIDVNKFSRLISRIIQKLHLKGERTFSEEEEQKLEAALSLDKQALNLVLETAAFILEQAVYHNVKPAALQQQLEAVHLNSDKAEVFSQSWATAGPELLEKLKHNTFAPKKLEYVGWQLNLQMAQSSQARLKSPSAILQLGLRNDDSEVQENVFVEFNHQELLELYNKLEIVQGQLDSLT
ncbi:putative COMM domain-containing protein 10 [Scophthalmus maximus]|uniref:Putative COMM domain-containing protein 10 n=1 Tax=Scophthalmus maximus TaxID=52904 RepID=A0A2U9BTJ6_SCOMX|nr:putative COMM domain-containing protein 10 [Scophthalmus maximus]